MVTVHIDNVLASKIGPEHGLTMEEVARLAYDHAPGVIGARAAGRDRPAFTRLPEQSDAELAALKGSCDAYRAAFPGELRDVVVLGIGGSALGARALKYALLHPYDDMRPGSERAFPRLHVLDNVDPWQIAGLLDVLRPESTAFIAITKSGPTAETNAGLAAARAWLAKADRDWKAQTIIITNEPDPKTGKTNVMWDMAEANGITRFEMPIMLGGRWSVLSAVGLVPAALTGMDIHGLVHGAAAMYERCDNEELVGNPAFLLSAVSYLYWTRFSSYPRNITVMMPYSYALQYVGEWFQQLWAESLGKRFDLDGHEVHLGQTPVRAMGATDQHSQLQLYQEGPHDKLITFLEVEDYGRDVPIEAGHCDVEYLVGASFGALLSAEKRGTEFALTQAGRPSLTIRVPKVTAEAMGELFFLFEMQTAVTAEILNINAYDQPGVEGSKIATRALMGAAGAEYDAARKAMGV